MDKHFDTNRPCQAVSKQFIKHYKPEKPTLLIAINDFNDQFKPFKERVNYLTYSNYVDVCWLYFDDISHIPFGGKSPNMFTKAQAKELIHFLDKHFDPKDFERILVHCYAGVVNYNCYDTRILMTKDKTLHNNDYVATSEGLFIIDIPDGQSIVTKQPEKLILPLTNVVTGDAITMSFTDIMTKQDDAFYHILYSLYTGKPTETRGYLKAAHQYSKEFKKLVDHAILKHALSSEDAFKQALKDLCDEHDGYVNTRGTVDGSIFTTTRHLMAYCTSLNGDTVITTENKYGSSIYAMHLKKRTETPIHLYMQQIADLQPKGSLYEAIENLNKQFAQTRNI